MSPTDGAGVTSECPKRMQFGPCGGVRPDGGCEMVALPCVFPSRVAPTFTISGAALPVAPLVLTDVSTPPFDDVALTRAATMLAAGADAVLVGEHHNRPDFPPTLVARMLLDAGASICAHDPAGIGRAKLEMPPHANLEYTDDPYAAADNADALLILTDWAEFTRLDLKKLRYTLRYPIIIDGRNMFDPWVMQDLGFTYLCVGRPSQHTSVESASTKRWP